MQGLAACVIATDLGARFCREGRVEDALMELGEIRTGLNLAVDSLRDIMADLAGRTGHPLVEGQPLIQD
ncbi:MAG: hypothetical protein ACKVVP_05085 [Chloroflexota bacterium]